MNFNKKMIAIGTFASLLGLSYTGYAVQNPGDFAKINVTSDKSHVITDDNIKNKVITGFESNNSKLNVGTLDENLLPQLPDGSSRNAKEAIKISQVESSAVATGGSKVNAGLEVDNSSIDINGGIGIVNDRQSTVADQGGVNNSGIKLDNAEVTLEGNLVSVRLNDINKMYGENGAVGEGSYINSGIEIKDAKVTGQGNLVNFSGGDNYAADKAQIHAGLTVRGTEGNKDLVLNNMNFKQESEGFKNERVSDNYAVGENSEIISGIKIVGNAGSQYSDSTISFGGGEKSKNEVGNGGTIVTGISSEAKSITNGTEISLKSGNQFNVADNGASIVSGVKLSDTVELDGAKLKIEHLGTTGSISSIFVSGDSKIVTGIDLTETKLSGLSEINITDEGSKFDISGTDNLLVSGVKTEGYDLETMVKVNINRQGNEVAMRGNSNFIDGVYFKNDKDSGKRNIVKNSNFTIKSNNNTDSTANTALNLQGIYVANYDLDGADLKINRYNSESDVNGGYVNSGIVINDTSFAPPVPDPTRFI